MFGSYLPTQINIFLKRDLLLLFSCSVVSDSAIPWAAARQASLSTFWNLLKLTSMELVILSSHLIHPLLSPSPPAFNLSQHQGLFQWVDSASGGQSIGASVSASVLPMNIQDWNWFELLAVQGTLECSPTPQFESINSLTLSLFYDATLTSIPDYWNSHSFDYIDLSWQSNVSAF